MAIGTAAKILRVHDRRPQQDQPKRAPKGTHVPQDLPAGHDGQPAVELSLSSEAHAQLGDRLPAEDPPIMPKRL